MNDPYRNPQERSGRSPWVYVLGGCLVLVVLAGVVLGGLVWWGYQETKSMVETMSDPAKREAKVLEVLGSEEPPPGLYPAFAISVPFIVDFAVLSSEPVEDVDWTEGEEPDVDLDAGGLIFMRVRQMGDRGDVDDFLEGSQGSMEVGGQEVDFDRRERLGDGRFELQGVQVRFATFAGELDGRDGGGDAVMVHFAADCPTGRIPMGMWFRPVAGPEGAEETESEGPGPETETAGETVAEAPAAGEDSGSGDTASEVEELVGEPELRELLAHLELCR